MNQVELRNFCANEIDRRIDRMHELCLNGRTKDATALYLEIQEWIVDDQMNVVSLEYISDSL
jgi:hypothetical protein